MCDPYTAIIGRADTFCAGSIAAGNMTRHLRGTTIERDCSFFPNPGVSLLPGPISPMPLFKDRISEGCRNL